MFLLQQSWSQEIGLLEAKEDQQAGGKRTCLYSYRRKIRGLHSR